tara:strand:+ start:697 stop:912 length:216 start_codon:yes stop_codon:yes gene_type:complete
MLVELLQLMEATMVVTTLTIGVVAAGSAVLSGAAPPDITSLSSVYEHDDKRIYLDRATKHREDELTELISK